MFKFSEGSSFRLCLNVFQMFSCSRASLILFLRPTSLWGCTMMSCLKIPTEVSTSWCLFSFHLCTLFFSFCSTLTYVLFTVRSYFLHTMTGHLAWWMMKSDTLPKMVLRIVPMPRVPITIMSAWNSSAARTIASPGFPYDTCIVQLLSWNVSKTRIVIIQWSLTIIQSVGQSLSQSLSQWVS